MLHLTTIEESTYKILQSIFNVPFVRETFGLAGGTSLALQIGHRRSIDLDFFSTNIFDIRELEIILSSTPGLKYEFSNKNSRMLFCYINDVKCDFVNDPALLINESQENDGVIYYSVGDIAAMKMHTVIGRGKKKDFFDLNALLKIYSFDKLREWFIRKYDENQLFFFYRSVLYFEDAENDPDPETTPPFNEDWNKIKENIKMEFKMN